jgi:hypothetical protein
VRNPVARYRCLRAARAWAPASPDKCKRQESRDDRELVGVDQPHHRSRLDIACPPYSPTSRKPRACGASWTQYRGAALYIDRLLRGWRTADLPVQAAERFETILNLKTANELGLTISPTLLASADEVIDEQASQTLSATSAFENDPSARPTADLGAKRPTGFGESGMAAFEPTPTKSCRSVPQERGRTAARLHSPGGTGVNGRLLSRARTGAHIGAVAVLPMNSRRHIRSPRPRETGERWTGSGRAPSPY